MNEDYTKFGNDLDALSRRIEERARELRDRGHLSDSREVVVRAIQSRQGELRDRISTAIREGRTWDALKAEAVRDYSSLFDNVQRFERQIDSDFADDSKAKAANGRT